MVVEEWVNMGESDACVTGMWMHASAGTGAQVAPGLGRWDKGVVFWKS
jgi:hypothetical protein